MLHAGNGYVPFSVYLYRVFLFVALVVLVATAVRGCLAILDTVDLTTGTEQDIEEGDDARE